MIAPLSLFLLFGCSNQQPRVLTEDEKREAKSVLLVINSASQDSAQVGAYYRQKRGIPSENVVLINVSTTENVPLGEYESGILEPVRKATKSGPNHIDYIVLTKGVPLRIGDDGGYSVDGHLATMNLNLTAIKEPKEDQIRKSLNPYFNKDEEFSSDKFGMYLVTRLDGFNLADAKALVDRSLEAKAEKGPFLFDMASNRDEGGYEQMQKTLSTAHSRMTGKGFTSTLDQTPEFVGTSDQLAGYASWGSNDGKYSRDAYKKLRFKPGALAETFVSTSAFTFQKKEHWQSLIADLVEQGVTGVKGYVSEPYTFALARPEILFDRYTSGYNLAESFYMASIVTKWKDVVIGDPLCRPYRKE